MKVIKARVYSPKERAAGNPFLGLLGLLGIMPGMKMRPVKLDKLGIQVQLMPLEMLLD